MVNNSTNINKNHLWPQLTEWWSTIPTNINNKSPLHHRQKSPLTSTHWVIVNNSTTHWVTVNSLMMVNNSPPTITPLFNSLSDGQQFHQYQQKSHLNSLSDGQQFHQYQQKSPLTFNSLSDGQQFHQYQQQWPLTSTHWVMVNNSTNINNKSPLTSTHWVMVNNSTISTTKSPLSLQLIEWWSTIPPISTKITSHLNSLSDGQQFHQYQQKSPLTSTHWVMVNNSTNINKNHLSLTSQLIEWWSTIPPISTTNINKNHLSPSTHWVIPPISTKITSHQSLSDVKITPISTKITSHFNSLNDGQQFHQYQQKSPLT